MEEWLHGNDSLTLHTSGSTGTPKPLLVSKKSMQASAERTAAFFELSPGDTALLCLPIRYIAGKMMLVRAVPMGYMGPPQTIADAALFLVSDLSTYMTGAQMVIDGGLINQ